MELWLPWAIPLVSILVAIGALRVGFCMKIGTRWLRYLLRMSAGLLSLFLAFVTLFSLLMICFESNGPLVGSVDHRHVARVQVSEALGAIIQPVASVAVRHSWSPVWTNAYVGLGYPRQDGTFEPKIRWIDNSHLLITFPDGGEHPVPCVKAVGDILVTCEIDKRVN